MSYATEIKMGILGGVKYTPKKDHLRDHLRHLEKMGPICLGGIRCIDAKKISMGICSGEIFLNFILLMVQKSGDHQLRLVVFPIIYKVLAPSQVVQDFFHQP